MKENMLSFEFLPKLASIGLSARLLGRSMQLGPLVRVKCTFFTRIERIPIKTGDCVRSSRIPTPVFPRYGRILLRYILPLRLN